MSTVTVSRKGWVVIPKEIRERHGIKPGDRVHVIEYGRTIAIVPVAKDPIAAAYGMFKGGPSMTKGLLEDRQEELEREERDLPPPRPLS